MGLTFITAAIWSVVWPWSINSKASSSRLESGIDPQNPADQSRTIVHDANAQPLVLLRLSLNTHSVIPDTQLPVFGVGVDTQLDVPGSTMPQGVAGRFLSDAELR